jgi:hypothetical protein
MPRELLLAAAPSRARRATPNMPRSPREDGVNNPSRGPRGSIAPPVGKGPSIGPRQQPTRGVTPRSPREDGVNKPSTPFASGPAANVTKGKGPSIGPRQQPTRGVTPRSPREDGVNKPSTPFASGPAANVTKPTAPDMAAKKAQQMAQFNQMAKSGVIKPGSGAQSISAQQMAGMQQPAGMGKPTPPGMQQSAGAGMSNPPPAQAGPPPMGGLGGLSKWNDASPTGTMGGMGKPTPPMGMPPSPMGMGKPTPPMGMGAMAAMGGMAKPMGMKKGGKVGGRGDGIATKGKTKGRMC